ncbi:8644_t:CDS:2, partial [Scutellospora calospora]
QMEGTKNFYPNKKDRIILHLKKCPHFVAETTAEEREKIYKLVDPTKKTDESVSSASYSSLKIIRSSSFGPMDDYIVRALSPEDPEAAELFEFLNLLIKLPDRRMLGGRILKDATNKSNKAMLAMLKENQVGIMLTFDSWTNVRNEHLLGVVIIMSEGRPYVWKALNISLECETHIEVIEKINMINPMNKFFIAKLKDEQYAAYKKYFAISVPGETRWNSFYTVCSSILRSQKILAIKFEPPVGETSKCIGSKPKLKREIYEIISSSNFWADIRHLLSILWLYCFILNKMQSDKARLHQVILSMSYLAQFWDNYDDL